MKIDWGWFKLEIAGGEADLPTLRLWKTAFAFALARKHAAHSPHAYCHPADGSIFEPHEWVVGAILEALDTPCSK